MLVATPLLLISAAAVLLTPRAGHRVLPKADHKKPLAAAIQERPKVEHVFAFSGRRSPGLPGDLAASATVAKRFTIYLPAGAWVNDELEIPQPDDYVDSHWHSPQDSNVTFVVDYTPNFAATAVDAANSVRSNYARVSSYRELNYRSVRAGGGSVVRWEYTYRDERTIDMFAVACDTSFAVSGSTPARQWSSHWSRVFTAAIGSLTTAC
jgi:hypothetical protein